LLIHRTWNQSLMVLNNKKYLFIPDGDKIFMKFVHVDGIICNRKDYDDNYDTIKTYNKYTEQKLITIFLDEL